MVLPRTKKLRMVLKKLFSPAPSTEKIFTLPSCSLPSQYRSLLPARDAKAEELMRLERNSRRIRNVVLALVAFLIVFVVGVVSVVITAIFHHSTQDQSPPTDLSIEASLMIQQDLVSAVELSHTSSVNNTPYQIQTTGRQCMRRCWEFSAFKFSATCESGRCRCHNKAYQQESCLPRFGSCAIQLIRPGQERQLVQVLYNHQVEPVYSCSTSQAVSGSLPDSKESRGMDLPRRREENHDTEQLRDDDHGGSFQKTVRGNSREEGYRENLSDEDVRARVRSQGGHGKEGPSTSTETWATEATVHEPKVQHEPANFAQQMSGSAESSRDKTKTGSEDSSFRASGENTSKHITMQPGSFYPGLVQPTLPSVQSEETTNVKFLKHEGHDPAMSTAAPRHDSPSKGPFVTPHASLNTETRSRSTRGENQVHVISVHGDHTSRHSSTSVTVRSSRRQSIVLVLVSYSGRHWNLFMDDTIELEEIILVSNHRISKSSLSLSDRRDQGSDQLNTSAEGVVTPARSARLESHSKPPVVTRKLLRTGYGDDRRRGDTPQLLKSITELFGEIRSFIGVARADSVIFDADFKIS